MLREPPDCRFYIVCNILITRVHFLAHSPSPQTWTPRACSRCWPMR